MFINQHTWWPGGISTAYGSGSAKIGNTSVVAGITAQVGHPIESEPAAGDIGTVQPTVPWHI